MVVVVVENDRPEGRLEALTEKEVDVEVVPVVVAAIV